MQENPKTCAEKACGSKPSKSQFQKARLCKKKNPIIVYIVKMVELFGIRDALQIVKSLP